MIDVDKDKLIIANKRLQNRISELKSEVNSLKRINRDLELKHKQYMNTQISKGIQYVPEIKLKSYTKKENLSNKVTRKDKISSILNNISNYKLTPIEKDFLMQIKDRDNISEKQYNWYQNIIERGK